VVNGNLPFTWTY